MADALSPQLLSKLTGSIYDCALDPNRWEKTLAEILEVFDGETVNLSLNDLQHDRVLIEKSLGWGQRWLDERNKHLPEIHARLSEWLAREPSLDEPFVASRHIPPAHLEASAYVRDCLKPRGIADIMHYFLIHTPKRFSELVIGRHQRLGLITDREIEIGCLLLPHIRRAVTISNVLEVRTIEAAGMAQALDALRCGVVLTDGSGHVLHANRAADEMLRDGGSVQGTGGVLQATAPAAAAELRAAIALAARDEAQIGKTGLSICLAEFDAPPIFAHVLPMNGGELRTHLEPSAVAAVFIGAPQDEEHAAEAMSAAFGLTTAERRVLAGLLAGRTVAETAAALGIAATTVRTHLDNIFLKTGVSRQADLMRLAAQTVPPTAASR